MNEPIPPTPPTPPEPPAPPAPPVPPAPPTTTERSRLDGDLVKYAIWMTVVVVTILAGTAIAIFADPDDQAWVSERIIPFAIGLAIPGSPIGRLFGRKPAAVVASALVAMMLVGCGGATAAQRTDYAAEVARCVAAERAIVDRESTEAEDAADLAVLRAECDANLERIEHDPR